MDLCHDWHFRPFHGCAYGMLCSAVAILVILVQLIYLIRIKLSPPVQYCSGYLPFMFAVSSVLHILLIINPVLYVVIEQVLITAQISLFLICHTAFWLMLLTVRFASRNFFEHPIPLVLSEAFAVLVVIVPLFFWTPWIIGSFHPTRRRVIFYILHLIGTLLVYFATLSGRTLRVQGNSNTVWAGFTKKTSQVLPYIWPRKSIALQIRVFLCLLLLIIGRVINVSLPLYNKWIVDGLFAGLTVYHLIIISCILKFMQGGGAMGGFLNTLRSFLWIPVQQYTTYEVQVELFDYLHKLSLRWHLSRKTGQVLRIMDRGTSSIDSILNYVVFNILPTVVDIIIAVIFFFITFNVYFGLLVLLTMVVYLGLTVSITEWRTKFRREMNEKENYSRLIGVDSLLNYETVKYYNAEELEVQRFANSIKDFQQAEWRSIASLSLLNLSQNATIGVGLAAGSLLVAYLISLNKSELTAGDYVLFTTYILQLYTPLNFFGTVYRVIQQAFIDMENMFELLDEDIEVKDKPNALPLKVQEGNIVFENVQFGYTSGRVVLNGVSFAVGRGETVALVGPSGAGKSTVIRLLFRLFDVTGGRIFFDGQDIRDVRMKTLRKHIGIVPQDTVLFNETIRYNIRFGKPTATDEEVEDAARAAEIHERILSLPDGYDTVVGERGLKLSGGEKQRVAIARTVLKQPQFILLDEATSALDTATERAIQRCLTAISATRTTVVVAHRLSTIVNADRILVLENGSIVESGTHADLLALHGRYHTMWEAQNEDTRLL